MLRRDQFTSFITNLDQQPLNSIKVFKKKDLVILDENTKQLRKLDAFEDDEDLEISQVEDSLSAVDALNLNEEDSKINEDEFPLNILFVGIIDINK